MITASADAAGICDWPHRLVHPNQICNIDDDGISNHATRLHTATRGAPDMLSRAGVAVLSNQPAANLRAASTGQFSMQSAALNKLKFKNDMLLALYSDTDLQFCTGEQYLLQMPHSYNQLWLDAPSYNLVSN